MQDALDANKRLQQILTQRAEQLEANLKEVDSLLVSVPTHAISADIDPQHRMLRTQVIFETIQSRRL